MSHKPPFEHIAVAGDVIHPGREPGAYGLYRARATGVYALGDQIPGPAMVMRPCPQDWARTVHFQALVRSLTGGKGRRAPDDPRPTRADIARELGVPGGTIENWMRPWCGARPVEPPLMAVKLLELIAPNIQRVPAKKERAKA